MKRVYISGPMSFRPGNNFEAFDIAARDLANLGLEPVNPAELDRTAPLRESATWEDFLKRDLAIVLECDAVCVLEHWQTSAGAAFEVDVARRLRIPVIAHYEWDAWRELAAS